MGLIANIFSNPQKRGLQLIEAITANNVQKAQLLIKNARINLSVKGKNGDTPLHLALKKGNSEIARFLIEKGAEINSNDGYYQWGWESDSKWTPLLIAIDKSNFEITKILVDHGADLNLRSHSGRSALILALEKNKLEIAEFLIQNGIDINAKGYPAVGDDTAMILSATKGFTEIVRLLIEKGADVNSRNRIRTVLHEASKKGFIEIIQLLIEKGADVNTKDCDGYTAIHEASKMGFTDIVRLLVKNGADVNIKPGRKYYKNLFLDGEDRTHEESGYTDGVTALYYARKGKYAEIVQLLMDAGAKE